MFTVAVVEDEYWAMQAILHTFKWQQYGFKVVVHECDPLEALEEILEKKPDVVFADVRMPKLNGLELMARLREAKLPCELVVLSGYSEFEYARAAISLGVFDYSVKPVDEELADNLLKRLASHLSQQLPAVQGAAEPPTRQSRIPQPLIPVKNAPFKKLLDYIGEYYGEQMHITKLAKMFYINASYCCKLFDQTFGKNFCAYVTDVRMENAQRFLMEGLTVKETAHRTGYTDYFYFTKAFKKYFGITPTKFCQEQADMGAKGGGINDG